jgi:hypothetical protein
MPRSLRIERQERYSRWLPLLKWLIAIPHMVVMLFLGLVKGVLVIVSLLWILVTGRYPRFLFGPVEGIQRFNLRLHAYLMLTRDGYLPMSFRERDEYGVHYDIAEPGRIARWRALVQPITVLPLAIVAQLFMSLAWVVSTFAGVAIIFTGRYPQGMFDMVERALNWQVEAINYGCCVTTRYPF